MKLSAPVRDAIQGWIGRGEGREGSMGADDPPFNPKVISYKKDEPLSQLNFSFFFKLMDSELTLEVQHFVGIKHFAAKQQLKATRLQ